ncbi:conserved hypothetical protein [delta proteobacterium NaphS2]|nr:conserved hypothetical protein [delta proteobacterium NaphS2]
MDEQEWVITLALSELLKKLDALMQSENAIMVSGEPGTGKNLFVDAAVTAIKNEGETKNKKSRVEAFDLADPRAVKYLYSDSVEGKYQNMWGRLISSEFHEDHRYQVFVLNRVNFVRPEDEGELLFCIDYLNKVGVTVLGTFQENEGSTFRDSLFNDKFNSLNVPPLRERTADIFYMMEAWAPEIIPDLRRWEVLNFIRNEWPGNIPALRKVLRHIEVERKCEAISAYPFRNQDDLDHTVTARYLKNPPVAGLDSQSFRHFVESLDPEIKPEIETLLNERGLSLNVNDTVRPFEDVTIPSSYLVPEYTRLIGFKWILDLKPDSPFIEVPEQERPASEVFKVENLTMTFCDDDRMIEIRLSGKPPKRESLQNMGFKKPRSKESQDFKKLLTDGELVTTDGKERQRRLAVERHLQKYFQENYGAGNDVEFMKRIGNGHYTPAFKVGKTRASSLEVRLRKAKTKDEALSAMADAWSYGEITEEAYQKIDEYLKRIDSTQFDYEKFIKNFETRSPESETCFDLKNFGQDSPFHIGKLHS